MKKFILAVVVLAVVAAVWLWYAGKLPWLGAPAQPLGTEVGFGGSLYENIATENPVAKLPETNPFKAKINPFTNTYKNPFKS